MAGTIICEVGTIICDIGTINVRFHLLEVRYPHGYRRITRVQHSGRSLKMRYNFGAFWVQSLLETSLRLPNKWFWQVKSYIRDLLLKDRSKGPRLDEIPRIKRKKKKNMIIIYLLTIYLLECK